MEKITSAEVDDLLRQVLKIPTTIAEVEQVEKEYGEPSFDDLPERLKDPRAILEKYKRDKSA